MHQSYLGCNQVQTFLLMKISRQGILYISIAFFALSCLLPAVNHKIGLLNLISGVFLPFYPYGWPYLFFWLANVLYYFEIKNFKKEKPSFMYGAIAFVLAILFYVVQYLNDFNILFTNEKMPIQIGYYIWTLNFAVLPIYQLSSKSQDK